MTTTYVLNVRAKRWHIAIDGRTHESCNLDQVEDARIYNATAWALLTLDDGVRKFANIQGKRYALCKRCFPHGLPQA